MGYDESQLIGLRCDLAFARLQLALLKASRFETKRTGQDATAVIADRQAFEARLEALVRANSEMLIRTLAKRQLTSSDSPDVSRAREETLSEWDGRVAAIERQWRHSPQQASQAIRLTEEVLGRRFTGRINAERQRALGISRYIWRSRDDANVRRAHAAYDDRVFAWSTPPADGHPGEAINCRCIAEPLDRMEDGQVAPFDGFELRFGPVDREAVLNNAATELRLLGEVLKRLSGAEGAEAAEAQRALAEAYRAAATRYALAAPNAGDLESSGLVHLTGAERTRLLTEAQAFRAAANDLARAMDASDFFRGTTPRAVVAELRRHAPMSADRYLNATILLAAARHVPQSVVSGPQRAAILRDLGGGLVAAARAVEDERWGGRPLFRNAGQLAQWDALHGEMQRLASQGARPLDGEAATAGMRQETGRRFAPTALEAISGGVLGFLMRGARAPVRITREKLAPDGTFLGERNAGPHSPRFDAWLKQPESSIEIVSPGIVRYATRMTDPSSRFAGQAVSVDYNDGVPDFSPYSVARANVPDPVGRPQSGRASDADARAATRLLRDDIRAGRVRRDAFTPAQLADIERGKAQVRGLTWHHDGLRRNRDGTGPMQLVDTGVHNRFSHWGWATADPGEQ